jgi:hypothetical protein
MSLKPQKRSAISRLVSLLGQPAHVYEPATQIFVDLNADRLANEMQLVAEGTDRGGRDRPPETAQTPDEIEHKIVERIEAHKQASHAIYLEHLHTYDQRMSALNFEERFGIIRQAAPEAVGEFAAEAALGRDQLFALRRRLYENELERDQFRDKHKIRRPARLATPGKLLLKVGLLAILFVVEVSINGSFLAKSNLGGLLGGAVQAVSFAALNIIASFLFGLVPIRLINRRNVLWKLVGLLSAIVYLAFAIALNLTLAHLREVPPSINVDVGRQVLNQLLTAPHVLHDVNSWVFFAVGLTFSFIAAADGLLFFDPYIGYAGIERRWLDASRHYTERKTALVDDLRDIRDDSTDAMNQAANDLAVRRSEYDAILQSRARLSQRFVEHQNQIERTGRSLTAIYREANHKARTTPPPAYFEKPYTMERIPPSPETRSSNADELERKIEEARGILAKQINAIHEAFDAAARSYREIDDMIPEVNNGPTKTPVSR